MAEYTTTLVDEEEDIERMEVPRKSPRHWRWLGLSLVAVVVVCAVYGSVRRPRGATMKHRMAIVSKVARSFMKNLDAAARKLESSPSAITADLVMSMKEGGEELDGMAIEMTTNQNPRYENGTTVTFEGKNGSVSLKEALDSLCSFLVCADSGKEHCDGTRRLDGGGDSTDDGDGDRTDSPCKTGMNEDDNTAYLWISNEEEDQEMEKMSHDILEVDVKVASSKEMTGLKPQELEDDKHEWNIEKDEVKGTVTFGRSCSEMVQAADGNKHIAVLPRGVKVNMSVSVAKAMGETVEQQLPKEEQIKLAVAMALTKVMFHSSFEYDKDKLQAAMMELTGNMPTSDLIQTAASQVPGNFKGILEHLADQIAGLKSVELDIDGEALMLSFKKFEIGELFSAIADRMSKAE